MKKTPIILDTDPGIDDAIALAVALKCDEIDIKLITTVAGNVGIDKTTNNALGLLQIFEREDITVAKGASEPLIVKYEDASEYHGKSGMGSIKFDDLMYKAKENAIEEMKNLLLNCEEKITIVAVGPLTNIALLLKTYPNVKEKIEEIVIMGGAIGRGNKEVLVEYNIGADPHAAKIVFDANVKLTMLGLEMGDNAKIAEKDLDKLTSKIGQFCSVLLRDYKGAKVNGVASIYDATAIAYLVCPSMYETKKVYVDIEIEGKYTKGATIVDMNSIYKKEANVYVPYKIDGNKFKKWIIDKLSM